MHGKYRDYLKELDLSLLPEVHALSSGLKALAAKVSGSYTVSTLWMIIILGPLSGECTPGHTQVPPLWMIILGPLEAHAVMTPPVETRMMILLCDLTLYPPLMSGGQRISCSS